MYKLPRDYHNWLPSELTERSRKAGESVQGHLDRITTPLEEYLWEIGQRQTLIEMPYGDTLLDAARDIRTLQPAVSACSQWRTDNPIPTFIREQLRIADVPVDHLTDDWHSLSQAYMQGRANMASKIVKSAVTGALMIWREREKLDKAMRKQGRATSGEEE